MLSGSHQVSLWVLSTFVDFSSNDSLVFWALPCILVSFVLPVLLGSCSALAGAVYGGRRHLLGLPAISGCLQQKILGLGHLRPLGEGHGSIAFFLVVPLQGPLVSGCRVWPSTHQDFAAAASRYHHHLCPGCGVRAGVTRDFADLQLLVDHMVHVVVQGFNPVWGFNQVSQLSSLLAYCFDYLESKSVMIQISAF